MSNSHETSYYVDLFTGEYQNSPKLLAFAEQTYQLFRDVQDALENLDPAFDLDLAVGVQLDVLGEIVGVPREVPFQPSYGVSPILEDETYRVLLKATIGRNHWLGAQTSLEPLWANIFPDSIIAIHDNHYMDMDVFLEFPSLSSIFLDLIEHGYIVPRPEGVLQRVYEIPPKPLFGFDYDDPYVSGFDKGNWYTAAYNRYPQFGFDADSYLISGFSKGFWYTAP